MEYFIIAIIVVLFIAAWIKIIAMWGFIFTPKEKLRKNLRDNLGLGDQSNNESKNKQDK